MEIVISVGEWMTALQNRMSNAEEGACFFLPTQMHLHAFGILKEQEFSSKTLYAKVIPPKKYD